MSSNINTSVLKAAGNVLYVNDYYEEAAEYYESALSANIEPDILLYAGIAYYKIGKKNSSKDYLNKAASFLEQVPKASIYSYKASYFLTLTYSSLGELDKAGKELENIKKESSFEEDALVRTIESFVFLKEKEASSLKQAYNYIEDPMLLDFYNFIYTYLRGTDFEKKLEKDNNAPFEEALAMELSSIYDKVMKMELSPLVKYVAIILFLLRRRGVKPLLEEFNKLGITEKSLKKVPVFTRAVIQDFLSKFGSLKGKRVKQLPYTLIKMERAMRSLSTLLKGLDDGSISAKEIRTNIKKFLAAIPDKELSSNLQVLGEGKPLYKRELKRAIMRALKRATYKLHKKAMLFYLPSEAQSTMKLLISDLPLPNAVKNDLILSI
ncbi:MAG: hypothetical protein D6769_03190 [Methanobacteriota archaeon]|nr:MAG: hypothetical protein D6769_03190 [Euryarchaeota archaeon]